MAQPFVKILNDKLSLVGEVPKGNPRVISILGKARMGKSTFLNAIVSHLMKQSQAPFKAMDCDDHCTRGIDSYYIKDHNLLLLDSQGLDYEDASHDPHLLLFLYIVSDLIVFNDTRRLENGALKLMESVCTFTNYLDIDTVVKPKLYFRIFDSDVKDPQKNLEKVLGTYQDQYQSIRKSIKHLFDKDICLLKTEPLDRPAKIMLANSMYRELLNEPLGFKEAIESVLTAAYSTKTKSILNKVSDVVENINNNKEISIEKLDVVTLQAENDIHKWIQENVPSSIYTEMRVDGTQFSFEQVVEPRKNEKKRILTAFTKRFKDVEESIRGPFYQTLAERMDAPIQKAIDESLAKAQASVATQLKEAHHSRDYAQVNSLNNSFTSIPENYWKSYLPPFNSLEQAITNLFEPFKKRISQWIEEVRSVVQETVATIKKEEQREAEIVKEIMVKMLEDMEPWMLNFMNSKSGSLITNKSVVESNDNHMKEISAAYMNLFLKEIGGILPRRKLCFKMTADAKLVACKEVVSSSKDIRDYDLVKPLFERFVDGVSTYAAKRDTVVRDTLIEQKMRFLLGYTFPNLMFVGFQEQKMNSWTQSLIKNNPEINFVEDLIVKQHFNINSTDQPSVLSRNIMTFETHEVTYLELYKRVFDHLVTKGYTDEKMIEKYGQKATEYPNLYRVSAACGNLYEMKLKELFTRRLEKEYCLAVMNKFPLPVELDPTTKITEKQQTMSIFEDEW